MKIHDFPRCKSSRAKRQLRNAYEQFVDRSHDAVESTRERVEERPLTLVVGALVLGVFLGRFVFKD